MRGNGPTGMVLAGWGMVLKRMRADGLIVAAALVTIVLAIVLLAAGPIYADAVTVAGARRTLADAPVRDANIAISQRVDSAHVEAVDALVTAEARRVLGTAGGELGRSGRSEPYALPEEVLVNIAPDQAGDERTRQTVFQFFDGIESHASIVEGRWPEPGGELAEVVLPVGGAEALELAVGDEFEVRNRLDARLTIPVRVVGLYQANDPAEAYWYEDPLPVTGDEQGQSVVVLGPLVTDRETFEARVMARLTDVVWRVLPDFERLELDDVAALRARVNALPARLERGNTGPTPYQVTTALGPLLAEIDRGLLAARSGVFILTLQLAILAGYALILTANLLADVRGVEMGLLRSRGAGVWQIAGFAVLEGLLLIVPAVLAGPWLAALSLRLLNVTGPLADIDLRLKPEVSPASYLYAALAGLGCLLALTVPAMLAARSILGARAARGREGESPLWQRAGADLALVAIAGLGFLQLRRFGSPLTETVRGRLELDPLLIAAPALGLLAGAVLALRVLPLLGRLVEGVAARGQALVPALGSWQVARRPGRYARSALLLMLALGIGLFAVSFSRTWTGSQADQADYRVGADIVVQPSRAGRVVPVQYLGGAYEALEGVADAMPVSAGSVNIPTRSGSARAIQLDATRADRIVVYREDLAEWSLSELMVPLILGRPQIAGIPLPDEPRRIALDARSTVSRICEVPEVRPDDVGAPGTHTYEVYACPPHDQLGPAELRRYDMPLIPSLVVRDARGTFYRAEGQPLRSPVDAKRLVFDLTAPGPDGAVFVPEYPVQIVEFELRTAFAPLGMSREGRLLVDALLVSDQSTGDEWQPVALDAAPELWEFGSVGGTGAAVASLPSMRFLAAEELGTDPPGLFGLAFSTGSGAQQIFQAGQVVSAPAYGEANMRLLQELPTEPIPILVSERLLVEIAFGDDAEFRLLLGGDQRRVRVAGMIKAFPSVAPGELAIIVDGPTLAALQYLESGAIASNFESWWLSVESGASEAVVGRLEAAPFDSNRIVAREEVAERLQADPVALGTLGALSLGFAAAAVFAVIGFVSSVVVGARERLTEFALLRAIGLSPRQLAGWMLLENGFLVAVSLAGGTALGLLLAWLILPLITVTREAEQVFPALIVTIPWRTILLLEAVVLATLLVVSLAMAVLLRRVGLGTALRIGEE